MALFFKTNFLKNYFRNTIRVSNSLAPDKDRLSVGPDLDPNCSQSYQQTSPNCLQSYQQTSEVAASME